MGNSFKRFNRFSNHVNYNSETGQKRKREEEYENETDNNTVDLHTPKRKRFKSTTKYIYETLFLKGQNSDVTIIALGKDWLLHKIYLSQSGYFSSMFSGPWSESSQNLIHIDITDKNIDENGLKIAFGSLYKDFVIMKPVEVISVLAAASLFLLEDLIEQCISLMKESISVKSVCTYHAASQIYSIPEIEELSFDWLLYNIMYWREYSLLKEISVDLMKTLVKSPDLFVLQVEMDIYSMLKKWMFLQCKPSWEGNLDNLTDDSEVFFKSYSEGETCFLECPEGKPFLDVFRVLRWQHIILDSASIGLLECDKILPIAWLEPFFRHQWMQVLKLEQGKDDGPTEVAIEKFLATAMRCGRVLPKKDTYCWRWVGYSYGIDLIITFQNRLVSVKRSMNCENYPGSVTMQADRNICLRMMASSLTPDGHVNSSFSTEIKIICLKKDETVALVGLSNEFKFPVYISMNLLFTTPVTYNPLPELKIPVPKAMVSSVTQTDPSDSENTCVPRTISHGDVNQVELAHSEDDYQDSDEETENFQSKLSLSISSILNSNTLNSSASQSKTLDSSTTKSKTLDSSTTKSKTLDSSTTKSKILDSSTTKSKTLDSSTTKSKTLDSITTKSKTLDSSTTKSKTLDSITTRSKTLDSSTAKSKTLDSSTTKSKTLDSRTTKSKTLDSSKTKSDPLDSSTSKSNTLDSSTVNSIP